MLKVLSIVLLLLAAQVVTAQESLIVNDTMDIDGQSYRVLSPEEVHAVWPEGAGFFGRHPYFSLIQGEYGGPILANNVSQLSELVLMGDSLPFSCALVGLTVTDTLAFSDVELPTYAEFVILNCDFSGLVTLDWIEKIRYLLIRDSKMASLSLWGQMRGLNVQGGETGGIQFHYASYIRETIISQTKGLKYLIYANSDSLGLISYTPVGGESLFVDLGGKYAQHFHVQLEESGSYDLTLHQGSLGQLNIEGGESLSRLDLQTFSIGKVIGGPTGERVPLAAESLSVYRANLADVTFDFEQTAIAIDPLVQLAPELVEDRSKQAIQETNKFFKRQLEKNREQGADYNAKALDLQYQRFLHKELNPGFVSDIAYFLQDWWWQFGYRKEKVLWNTGLIFLVFVVINLSMLRLLVTRVYTIETIARNAVEREAGLLRKTGQAILYTAMIFFGLKMDLGNLNSDKFWGAIYIFFQYAVGLVCLAFLANWVLFF